LQKFFARALEENCKLAIVEMTSEGARQHRHRGIELDALLFTNLAPEHIESHGSFEAYRNAKFSIGRQLARSRKRFRVMVANADDVESLRYLQLPVEKTLGYSLRGDKSHAADQNGGHFMFNFTNIALKLPGNFSLENALAAATLADAFGIGTPTIARALGKISRIPGRAEKIEAGQDFSVVVDYAHTPESLQALYSAYSTARKICVLGATGGGRDTWKRPVLGKVASENCDYVILTNEDPYDEDPKTIINQISSGMRNKSEVILDRREAISRGIEIALSMSNGQKDTQLLDSAPIRGPEQGPSGPIERRGDQNSVAVLITGKGTDPTIQGPGGSSIPWSDAQIAREALETKLRTKTV
jgi:UDP-N-acetylmuramoyl-L-alanyl-D-glutamate--2,6-diaminopimelate ligase